MLKLLSKLVEDAPLALIAIGAMVLVLGAMGGGLVVGETQLPVINVAGRVALGAVGLIVALVGLVSFWLDRFGSSSTRVLKKNYGIRIESPADAAAETSPIEVRGRFTHQPPEGLARILEYIPTTRTYWPKGSLAINSKAKTWSAKFQFGGASGEDRVFVVALVGPNGRALFEYVDRVAHEFGRTAGIRTLPSDVVLGEQVTIVIE